MMGKKSDTDKIVRFVEKFFFWGSVVLFLFFLVVVHKFNVARGPLAKYEYYRLGLYDKPIEYPTPVPYVPPPATPVSGITVSADEEESPEVQPATE